MALPDGFKYADEASALPEGFRYADDDLSPADQPKSRSWSEAGTDSLKQMGAGVNQILGAVPNLIDPTSDTSKLFNSGAEYWNDSQSGAMKSMLALREDEIRKSAENGEWEAFKTSLSTALSEPAIASKIVFETLPSMIPVLGAGKAATALSEVAKLSPKAAAWLQRGAMATANSALTAGDARSGAYEDLNKTYLAAGMTPEDASAKAMAESRAPAAVGAAFGAAGGAFGAEANILGNTIGKTSSGRAAGAIGTEVGTELGEEIAPLVTTNRIATETDNRAWSQNVGRTAADTMIGVGPMAVVGGVSAARQAAPSAQDQSPTAMQLAMQQAEQRRQQNTAAPAQTPVPPIQAQPEPVAAAQIDALQRFASDAIAADELVSEPIQAPSAQQPQETGAPVQTAAQPIQPAEVSNVGTTAAPMDAGLDRSTDAMSSANASGGDANGVLRYEAATATGRDGMPRTVVATDGVDQSAPDGVRADAVGQFISDNQDNFVKIKGSSDLYVQSKDGLAMWPVRKDDQKNGALTKPKDEVLRQIYDKFVKQQTALSDELGGAAVANQPAQSTEISPGYTRIAGYERVAATTSPSMATTTPATTSTGKPIWQQTRAEYIASESAKYSPEDREIAVSQAEARHKNSVSFALRSKKDVPQNVLADYPGIKQEISPTPAKSIAQDIEAQTQVKPRQPFAYASKVAAESAISRQSTQGFGDAIAIKHPTIAGKWAIEPVQKGTQNAQGTTESRPTVPARDGAAQADDVAVGAAVLPVAQEFSVAAETAKKARMQPMSRLKAATDERLTNGANRAELERMKSEFGWAEYGGRKLHATDSEGGRTQYLDLNDSQLWRNRPRGSSGTSGEVSESDAATFVDAALNGDPLPAKGHRFIGYLLDVAVERENQYAALAEETQKVEDTLSDEDAALLDELMIEAESIVAPMQYQRIVDSYATMADTAGVNEWNRALRLALRNEIWRVKNEQGTGQTEQAAKRQAGQADRPDGAQAGAEGNAGEVFALEQQTEQDLAQREAAQRESEQRAGDEEAQANKAQAERDQADINARTAARAANPDNFQFGENSKQAAAPVGDLFNQPAKSESSTAQAVNVKQPVSFVKAGDFWNYTGDRAKEIAKALDVTVTERDGKPMVGIPDYAKEQYAQQLSESGINAEFGNQTAQSATENMTRTSSIERIEDGGWRVQKYESGALKATTTHDVKAEAETDRITWERGSKYTPTPLETELSDIDYAATAGYRTGRKGSNKQPDFSFKTDEEEHAFNIAVRRAKQDVADEQQATAILDRANVTGKDRLDIMRDFKDGKHTLADLEVAFPAKDEAQAEQPAEAKPQGKIEDVAPTEPDKPNEYGANNKIVTTNEAEAMRALLRGKLGQINAGIDPETIAAGIKLAIYHIEAGARSFASYSHAMLADLGDKASPYLREWYESARQEHHFDGMTPAADIDEGSKTSVISLPSGRFVENQTLNIVKRGRKWFEATPDGKSYAVKVEINGTSTAWENGSRQTFPAMVDVQSSKYGSSTTIYPLDAEQTKVAKDKASEPEILRWLAFVEEKAPTYIYQNGVDKLRTLGINRFPALKARMDAAITSVHTKKSAAETEKQAAKAAEALQSKNYLDVPYEEKDIAKRHGAKWDSYQKKWYIIGDIPSALEKYTGSAQSAPIAQIDGQFRIGGGEGYGWSPMKEGQTLRNPNKKTDTDPEYVTVVSASKRYFREDGMSFGVGDESGYVYSAIVRPATDAEAAPLVAKNVSDNGIKSAQAEAVKIADKIKEDGSRPDGSNIVDGEKLLDTQNVYGGGEWFVIQPDAIWYVQNNGMDGDNWSANNVRTGGAGAIGWKIPFDAALAEKLRTLHTTVKTKETDNGVALFSRRIHGDMLSVQDYVVPETPEFDDNMSGDLAFTPQSAEVNGIDQLPIRLTVGVATSSHRGFGIQHIASEGVTDKRRMPPNYTDNEAENYARHVATIARGFNEIYKDGNKIILRSQRMKEALVVSEQNDPVTGEKFYSVISLRPAENAVWGKPEWVGRTALPTDRLQQSSASEPSPDQKSQRSDRHMQRSQTSHFDITRVEPDRQPKKQPSVTYKKRRAFTMDEVKKSQATTPVTNPHTLSTITAAIDKAFGNGFTKLLEATGKFNLITSDSIARHLGEGAQFSKAQDQTETENFKRWFGNSVVVNADGKPLVVYHGAVADNYDGITEFRRNSHFGTIYQAREAQQTSRARLGYNTKKSPALVSSIPVYLSIKNPKRVADANNAWDEEIYKAKAEGYDGIVYKNEFEGLRFDDDGTEIADDSYIIFEPTQAKSAIGNNGDFSPTNPDIRYSKDGRILAFVVNGQTYMVADNIGSDDSVAGLLRHELGVHALTLGRTDAEFQKILAHIETLRKMGNKKIQSARDRVPTDTPAHLELEEQAGYLIEMHPDLSIVQKLVARFRALLRMVGNKLPMIQRMKWFKWVDALTVEDVVYMATEATKRAPDTLANAQDRGVFKADRQSTFYSQQPTVTAQPPTQPPKQGKIPLQGGTPGNRASWDSPEASKLDNIIYTLQDKHIDMKRVVEAIKEAGGNLIEKFNPYLAEELFHGRAAKRTQDFVNTELKPLLADMRMRGLDIDALDKYLHARHAKEANDLIAQRDQNMQDGGSGMTNQEVDDYFANLPADKLARLEAAAKRVDDIITKTRDLYVSYGLVSKDQADGWAQMFQHYVPLMREDNDGGMGIGQGFSIKGKEVKHRTGSTAKVVDIVANIALQREKAIVRGEKNRVSVALAGLATLNPNPDFWTFDKPPTERVLMPKRNVYEIHYQGGKMLEFRNMPAAKAFMDYEGGEKSGYSIKKVELPERIEERVDPMFKSKPNVVTCKILDASGNAHERAIVFNERNERAMRMAEAINNLDATQLGGVMGVSAMITRYFASINTQYNPIFGIVNITRDVQAMALNLGSTPIAQHRMDVIRLIPSAVKGIYQDSRAEREGHAANSKWAGLWEELQDEGGMTGYRDLYRNSEDRADSIKSELDPYKWHNNALGKVFTANGALKVPLKIAQNRAGWLFDLLSDYNQTLEGATRLAAYKVARDNGMTKQQAASLAKNITVNFNRKGHIGQQAGAMYAFFNAAMQGSARIAQTMLTYQDGKVGLTTTGKAIVYGGITLGALQALMLAAAGFDDDEPPEFVRERALIIPVGGKKYLTLPMPLGFHVFPNIGRIPTEWALNGFSDTPERIIHLLGTTIEAFNPLGSAGMSLQTIMPTALDPFTALAENKDWTGKPIYKEDFNSSKPTPGFERNKDTATAWSKGIAEALNYMSGGTDYVPGAISPTADQIDYLIAQVTGGVGREVSKAAQTGGSVLTGEELPPHKMPLVGRFYGDSGAQSSQGNAYYSNLKRINEVEAEIKGRRENREPIDEYKQDNPEWMLIGRAKVADKIIRNLRKQKRELIEQDAPREKIRAIEDRITVEMQRLNEVVRKLKEKEAA